MPEDRKTNINNLTIVWQGQSWSVISPRGDVIYRSTSKREAFNYAKYNLDYVSEVHPSEDYLDDDFDEFESELIHKPKRGISTNKNKDNAEDVISQSSYSTHNKIPKPFEKLKLQLLDVRTLLKVFFTFIAVLIIGYLIVGFGETVMVSASGFWDAVSADTWSAILIRFSCFGIIVILLIGVIIGAFGENPLVGCVTLLLFIMFISVCNITSFLPRFWAWLVWF